MEKPQTIAIYFGEIWLKGRNRHSFIELLLTNIKQALEGEQYTNIENDRDRLFVHLGKRSNAKRMKEKLSKVFGISWIGSCICVKSDMASIVKGVVKVAGSDPIRVEAHRSYKSLPFTSYEIVSNLIKLSSKKASKLHMDVDAKKTIYVSVKNECTYISFDKIEGAHGLPVGSSGKAVVLLSGGIDSPVSSFYAMKRGLRPIYLHLHGFNTNKAKELSKMRDLVGLLSQYSGNSKLYLIPSHIFQGHVMAINRKFELILFKRFMYKLAERISEIEKADCIVTGESLGQVASQTLKNLEASSHDIRKFVVRPLIGMDKQEIIDIAKRLGTFNISIKPYKDVCSIGVKNPELSARSALIDKLYKESNMNEVLEETIAKSSKVIVK